MALIRPTDASEPCSRGEWQSRRFDHVARGAAGRLAALATCVLFSVLPAGAQTPKSFPGVIATSTCSTEITTEVPFGKDSKNVDRCYVLVDPQKKMVFALDNQNMARTFAARNVLVIGMLYRETRELQVESIVPALSPAIMQAKTIFIDCDDCERAMHKAKLDALLALQDWQRYKVVDNRRDANLIILLASNPYRGDYLTREKDERPLRIEVTYLNVIDPANGKSLWGDGRRAGSWRTNGAVKDLMEEFRANVEAEQGNVARLLLHYKKWNGERDPNQLFLGADGDK